MVDLSTIFFFSDRDTREKKPQAKCFKNDSWKRTDFTWPIFVKLDCLRSPWTPRGTETRSSRCQTDPRLEIPPRLVYWRCTRHLTPSTGREGVREEQNFITCCLSARACVCVCVCVCVEGGRDPPLLPLHHTCDEVKCWLNLLRL